MQKNDQGSPHTCLTLASLSLNSPDPQFSAERIQTTSQNTPDTQDRNTSLSVMDHPSVLLVLRMAAIMSDLHVRLIGCCPRGHEE
jgi:hypothetical protein